MRTTTFVRPAALLAIVLAASVARAVPSATGRIVDVPADDTLRSGLPQSGTSPSPDAAATVAALDQEYQAAVKRNDAEVMARILADDFVLVTGRGHAFTKADLLEQARNKTTRYERQDELEQKVRVWGDTAVVTALLWLKGTTDGKPFDRKLWFSDTYVRTSAGWKYVFGQASLALPAETEK